MQRFFLLSYESVIEVHNIVIEEYGGLPGILHTQYIEAALARPQSYMEYDDACDVYIVCALILDSFARNHAFADGNKRTALIAMLMTYNLNTPHDRKLRYSLSMNQDFEALVLWVATKRPSIKTIRNRFEKLVDAFSK